MQITRKRVKRPKRYFPLLADAALKVLHQDVTLFKTTNGIKHYVYVIRDNFSRAILACKIATECNSEIARQTLETVSQRFNLIEQPGTLITDGGMENKGKVEEWLHKPGMLWQKLVAQLDIVQSNSMVEAANKILKYRFLYTTPVADTAALTSILERAVNSYNNMPNAQLHGLTPNEAIAGARPDKYHFRTQIAIAQKRRITENQDYPCNNICQT